MNDHIKGLLAMLMTGCELSNSPCPLLERGGSSEEAPAFIAAGEYRPRQDYFTMRNFKLMADFHKVGVEDEMFAMMHPHELC